MKIQVVMKNGESIALKESGGTFKELQDYFSQAKADGFHLYLDEEIFDINDISYIKEYK